MTVVAERVSVERVTDEHLPALAGFYREVWDPEATVERVRASRAAAAASNPVSPGEPPPTWVMLRGDRAIAHVTTIPITVWLNGHEHPAHWLKGLWVLPEFQRSSAGFLVLRAAVGALDRGLALVHEQAAIRLFTALGFTDLGALPNSLRVLRARSLLGRLDVNALGLGSLPAWARFGAQVARHAAPVVGPLADAANAVWAGAATGPLGAFRVVNAQQLDRDAVEALWRASRAEMPAAPARDADSLARRYAYADYVFVEVRAGARLAGLAVVKRPRGAGDPRLRGIRVAPLADLLYQPGEPRAGLAALRGAEAAARSFGADALLCGASSSAVQPLLGRRGCLPAPANLHVLARFPAADGAMPATIAEWWFTRGDSEGDGMF